MDPFASERELRGDPSMWDRERLFPDLGAYSLNRFLDLRATEEPSESAILRGQVGYGETEDDRHDARSRDDDHDDAGEHEHEPERIAAKPHESRARRARPYEIVVRQPSKRPWNREHGGHDADKPEQCCNPHAPYASKW